MWDDVSDNSKAFLSSGNVTVSITGGQVGTLNGTSGTVFGTSEVTPTGMVFGGSRGRSAQDVMLDPRHEYAPDFYLGYVNNATVTIDKESEGEAPRIFSQVFGGGRDGHVRNSAHVIINNGTIGQTYAETTAVAGSTADYQRYHRGNVYGSGSGLGMWDAVHHGMSSGSVTRNTTVDINGGTIYNNVYGGGALSSVGPPKLDPEKDYAASTWSKCTVNINGGTIGNTTVYNDYQYGGCVFGASRGNDFAAGESTKDFATVLWTDVNISGGSIVGNVYGGGATGDVKGSTELSMTGGTVEHDVFGGGKGDATLFDCSKAMVGNEDDGACANPGSNENKDKGTKVTISNGTVNGNVYGGGEVGRVEWNTHVTVGDEDKNETAVSADNYAPVILGSVFGGGAGVETHGYSALVRGNTEVTVQGHAKIGHNVYGGGETAAVGRYRLDKFQMPSYLDGGGDCTVNVLGYAKIGPADGAGHVFGAGKGIDPTDADHAGVSYSSKTFKRMMVYSTDFVTGKTQGTDWDYYEPDHQFIWHYLTSEADYASYLETLSLATAPTVTIAGNASVTGDVYGGGERGITKGAVIVNINGGTIAHDVYGGGALANTNVANWVQNETTHNWEWLDGSKKSALHTTTVNLHSGTINGNVYGGGLGRKAVDAIEDDPETLDVDESAEAVSAVEPLVYGDVLVELNKESDDNCYVPNFIFGANNLNGSPQGHAKVHVYKTVNSEKSSAKDLTKKTPEDRVAPYDVAAVYGGGNQADYKPISTGEYAEVVIDGCSLTSIENVYGGGNAAATPATDVKINGCYIIDNVFGGGNGTVKAADVGYTNYLGTAKTNLGGGFIHKVFGGSNTNGNILQGSYVTNEKLSEETCDLKVSEVFGGGNVAPMQGGTEVVLGCMPGDWIDEVYAGAQNADVTGDVSLTITSGKFGRVFGGNKSGGKLDGGIVVNIEENPDCETPIVIGELYGGGNMAPYSAYGYKKDGNVWQMLRAGETGAYSSPYPVVVHAKAFTSIGKIFGGGRGAAAELIGNPMVLVDEIEGGKTYEGDNTTTTLENGLIKKTLSDDTEVTLYPRTSTGTMGVVGTIFGGGNEAPVEGNTTVKIATNEYVKFDRVVAGETCVNNYYIQTGTAPNYVYNPVPKVYAVANVDYYQRANNGTFSKVNGVNAGDDVSSYYTRSDEEVYTPVCVAQEDTIYCLPVKGADIRGNVYGGGNNAEVTGDTNVVIGRKAE